MPYERAEMFRVTISGKFTGLDDAGRSSGTCGIRAG